MSYVFVLLLGAWIGGSIAILIFSDDRDDDAITWRSINDSRPPRNRPCLYWCEGEFVEFGGVGYAAIADEWRDEYHLAGTTHWAPLPPPSAAAQREAQS